MISRYYSGCIFLLDSNDDFIHCVKSVPIRSFFWSECEKIRTRKNSVFGHFSRSDCVKILMMFIKSIVTYVKSKTLLKINFMQFNFMLKYFIVISFWEIFENVTPTYRIPGPLDPCKQLR